MKFEGLLELFREGVIDSFTWVRAIPFLSVPLVVTVFNTSLAKAKIYFLG